MMTAVTGAAGLVVAVTTGAVPVPLVSPGDAHESSARAEPVTLDIASAAPSGAPQDETGRGTGSTPLIGAVPGPSRAQSASSQATTAAPGNAARSNPGQGRSRGPSESPAPGGGSRLPTLPVPLPSTTSSFPSLPSLPGPPAVPLLP